MTSEARVIAFDLDGTLVHSAPDLQAATNVALRAMGRAELDLATIISFVGDGVEKLVQRSLAETGDATDALLHDALGLFMESYEQNMTTLTRPYPGVVACLTRLKADGVRLGICTNKPTGPARDICDQLELSHFFDVIEGATAGQPKKPEAKPLLDVISRLDGTADTAIFVGDSAVDCQTAVNAAVPFRLFNGGYLNTPLEVPMPHRFDHWDDCELLTSGS